MIRIRPASDASCRPGQSRLDGGQLPGLEPGALSVRGSAGECLLLCPLRQVPEPRVSDAVDGGVVVSRGARAITRGTTRPALSEGCCPCISGGSPALPLGRAGTRRRSGAAGSMYSARLACRLLVVGGLCAALSCGTEHRSCTPRGGRGELCLARWPGDSFWTRPCASCVSSENSDFASLCCIRR